MENILICPIQFEGECTTIFLGRKYGDQHAKRLFQERHFRGIQMLKVRLIYLYMLLIISYFSI